MLGPCCLHNPCTVLPIPLSPLFFVLPEPLLLFLWILLSMFPAQSGVLLQLANPLKLLRCAGGSSGEVCSNCGLRLDARSVECLLCALTTVIGFLVGAFFLFFFFVFGLDDPPLALDDSGQQLRAETTNQNNKPHATMNTTTKCKVKLKLRLKHTHAHMHTKKKTTHTTKQHERTFLLFVVCTFLLHSIAFLCHLSSSSRSKDFLFCVTTFLFGIQILNSVVWRCTNKHLLAGRVCERANPHQTSLTLIQARPSSNTTGRPFIPSSLPPLPSLLPSVPFLPSLLCLFRCTSGLDSPQ